MPGVTTAYQNGVHGSRPAASAGCILYACSTHSLIYRSDGSSWATWMTIGSTSTTVASDTIWDAAGDLAVGTGADAAAKLTLGSSGQVPASNGSTLAYVYPPGYEVQYDAITSSTSVTNGSGSPDTVKAGTSFTADGGSYIIEVYLPQIFGPAVANADLNIVLYRDSTALGIIGSIRSETTNRGVTAMYARVKDTPSSGSRSYTVKAWIGAAGTGGAGGGAGGNATTQVNGYIRVVKA